MRVNLTSSSAPAGVTAGAAGAADHRGRLLLVSTLAALGLLGVAGLRPGTAAPPAALPAAFGDLAGLSPRALAAALDAVAGARSRGVAGRDDLLTLIDYSLPSTAPRLWVLDLARGKVLFHELVAHGAGSGDNYATRFSNAPDSRQTSLGLFLTGGTYEGGNGYSLKLNGLDRGVNDLAEERRIVMHGAWYVSADHARSFGRLGRSWGCPALPVTSAHAVIDVIKNGTFLFSYAGGPAVQTVQAAVRSVRAAPAARAGSSAPATRATPATPENGAAITAAPTAALTPGTQLH